ncbi:hypothetical protein BC829DRAFT_186375 [Chytridium lagenaria]|nr:hypothetical protein BC829DRAFT_186375 [Chytridium lagenaria]
MELEPLMQLLDTIADPVSKGDFPIVSAMPEVDMMNEGDAAIEDMKIDETINGTHTPMNPPIVSAPEEPQSVTPERRKRESPLHEIEPKSKRLKKGDGEVEANAARDGGEDDKAALRRKSADTNVENGVGETAKASPTLGRSDVKGSGKEKSVKLKRDLDRVVESVGERGVDRAKEERIRDEKMKTDKLKEDRSKEEKSKGEKGETVKVEKISEEKVREDRPREERVKDEKVKEDKSRGDKAKEDKLRDEKVKEDRSKGVKEKESGREREKEKEKEKEKDKEKRRDRDGKDGRDGKRIRERDRDRGSRDKDRDGGRDRSRSRDRRDRDRDRDRWLRPQRHFPETAQSLGTVVTRIEKRTADALCQKNGHRQETRIVTEFREIGPGREIEIVTVEKTSGMTVTVVVVILRGRIGRKKGLPRQQKRRRNERLRM